MKKIYILIETEQKADHSKITKISKPENRIEIVSTLLDWIETRRKFDKKELFENFLKHCVFEADKMYFEEYGISESEINELYDKEIKVPTQSNIIEWIKLCKFHRTIPSDVPYLTIQTKPEYWGETKTHDKKLRFSKWIQEYHYQVFELPE